MPTPNLDDPTLLFTPQKPAPPPQPRREVFVELAPVMAPAEKNSYTTNTLGETAKFTPDEIIGEYTDGDETWYYARYKGGIAHKFTVKELKKEHPLLVAEYLRKQTAGELAPFSPSAHYIHPLSRVKNVVRIGRNGARSSISLNGSMPPSSDAEDVTDSDSKEEDDEGEDEEYEQEDSSVKVRRSTRTTTTKLPRQNLPFSPKKTRSQKITLVDSDDDEDEEEAPRRSTRNKGFKVKLDTAGYFESEQEDDSEGYASAPKPKRTSRPKAARKKGIRPAYGHVRGVGDLDCDYVSDEDTAPLRYHRDKCEKCNEAPAHEQLEAERKRSKSRGRRRRRSTTEDEFEESGDEEERITKRGGWVRCLKCPVAVHWGCLANSQKDEILKAIREVDRAAWRDTQPESELLDENGQPKPNKNEPGKRPGLEPQQSTDFVCAACTKGGVCMGCMEPALEPDTTDAPKPSVDDVPTANAEDVEMKDATILKYDATTALLFRCLVCKRLAHYEHLPLPPDFPPDSEIADIGTYYTSSWLCADCSSFTFQLDKILAWRPYPPNAVEPPTHPDETPNPKTPLPREYLVKWVDRSYRRTQWVPHMWLVSTNYAKLKNFLTTGPKVELLEEPVDANNTDEGGSTHFSGPVDSRASSVKPGPKSEARPQDALPDAERRIPLAWKTVDRVLDVLLWRPRKKTNKSSRKGKGKGRQIESDEDSDADEEAAEERAAAFGGQQPSDLFTESLEAWEERIGEEFSVEHADEVAWIFVKWDDLTYDEVTWDSPPRPNEPGYTAFTSALARFVASRTVYIPAGGKPAMHNRVNEGYSKLRLKDASDLQLGQDPTFKLMDFQVDGFNWLCDNWWNRQQCILADEMGLGKTVQIATFIGKIIQDFKAAPALVVVPNSTITNWIREFERWAPNLRVVPFYGEAKSRDVIRNFELSHEKKKKGFTNAKFHVLVTTYETLTGKDFTTVFKNQPRWEVLVVDEGQRLKSDSSLLFKKLNELNSLHRIIMTGTPLNNNIRELFNLMNFLDPVEWNDLEALAQKHETLTEDLVKDLHARLRPYFLRRIKSQVLKLPPKNEVIVPVSMAPLQKEIYRSILTHNLDLLKGLTGPANSHAPRGKLNNVLMHLRKCLQHPYLYAQDIEPQDLSKQKTHEKLIDASAKLRFLKVLLPKLKARGHRVLLFSQFVIALDVIEEFLTGEGHRYLRLDGNTKGKDRQKGMDEFNRPGSDVFAYLLTTRAGGVGINLYTADTVIIFDPDFNPHQDLQAIARAYRYGQKNTCLVFKLMVKDSAEERIIQVGKKKLVLDHLIVQKMDDDDEAGDNVESILTYGAEALFQADEAARDIIYTDTDIDKLIDKTEQDVEPEQMNEEALSFSFAKIWAAEKDSLEEVVEEEDHHDDSWAQTLQKINEDREKIRAQELAASGRGARRRAAAAKQNAYIIDRSPEKRSRSKSQDDYSAYGDSDAETSEDEDEVPDGSSILADALNEINERPRKTKKAIESNGPLLPSRPFADAERCSLCGIQHQGGECRAIEKSEHLAEYREMLIVHSTDEPVETRRLAVAAIDAELHRRGHMHLLIGQPLEVVERSVPEIPPKKKARPPAPAPRNGTAGPSKPSAAAANPRQAEQSNAVASSSKRTLSPAPVGNPPHKKPRQSISDRCIVCETSPYHLVKDCPVVAQGPKHVSHAIKRLEEVPATSGTVDILRRILAQQKKNELKKNEMVGNEIEKDAPKPQKEVIDISD